MNTKRAFLADFYELATANGLFAAGVGDAAAVFEMFFRRVPDGGGFAVMAGVETLAQQLCSLTFTDEELDFCRSCGFGQEFIDYLKNFKFSCDVWAVPEGTPVFPNEPLVVVKGPAIQAQLIETFVLNTVNHQSLIATKANRAVRAAQGRAVYERGARRAHGYDAAVEGARAAYIGGADGASVSAAGMKYGIPMICTMPHTWVQMFESEYDAFCAYLREHTEDGVIVTDTYDTLRSGVPNAIRAFNDVLVPLGKRPKGILIDSGDMTYLSKRARRMLDAAGFPDCSIAASNALDEVLIRDMMHQSAKIDTFIVEERLSTSQSSPVFDGVYKLCAIERSGTMKPAMMVSDNVNKITTPCEKKAWRLFDMETGKAVADVLTKSDETIDTSKPYTLFDPVFTWKRKVVESFVARELLVPVIKDGKRTAPPLPVASIRKYCAEQITSLWEEVLRFGYPHAYYVDLSEKLWQEKQALLNYRVGSGQ